MLQSLSISSSFVAVFGLLRQPKNGTIRLGVDFDRPTERPCSPPPRLMSGGGAGEKSDDGDNATDA
jgi:hypothetical protein